MKQVDEIPSWSAWTQDLRPPPRAGGLPPLPSFSKDKPRGRYAPHYCFHCGPWHREVGAQKSSGSVRAKRSRLVKTIRTLDVLAEPRTQNVRVLYPGPLGYNVLIPQCGKNMDWPVIEDEVFFLDDNLAHDRSDAMWSLEGYFEKE